MTNQSHPATVGGMRYAPIFAGLFMLWPIMALLGGQGYAPLLALTGLAALPFIPWRKGIAPYALVGIAFVVWAAITEMWSPASKGLITGSLAGGDLAIRAASIRLGLALLATMATVAAVQAIKDGQAKRSSAVIIGVITVHTIMVLVFFPFGVDLMEQVYASTQDSAKAVSDGIQNNLRNANAFSIVLPIIAALAWARHGLAWKALSAGLWGLSFIAFAWVGTQAALFGVVLALICIGVVKALPRSGFKWLMGSVGAFTLLAPALLGGGAKLANRFHLPLPGSFQSRVWSWDVVTEKIMDRPLTGHGLSASKTWRETYADYPEWLAQLPDFWATYPVVPGHPHNMPLQIWAETGFIGAGLAALAAFLIGWRLPSPEDIPDAIRYGIAGLIGTTMTLYSFAYSAWNEAFWAMIVLAVCALIVLYRQQRVPRT